MGSSFTGFLAPDFDAFSSEKWSSNMWNRQRLEIKQRAMTLGREVAARLASLGLPLSLGASDEHPSLWNRKRVECQWLFFWRNEAERKVLESIVDRDRKLAATLIDPTPFFRHAFLSVKIDFEGLELAFKVHRNAWVDAKNLHQKLATSAGATELVRLLAGLPEGFTFGAAAHEHPASEATPGSLSAVMRAYEQGEWFFVAARMHRERAIEIGTAVGDEVIGAFAKLAPVYGFLAWSHDNDFLSIDRALAQEAAERQVAHERLASEERARQEHLDREREQARERAKERGPLGGTSWQPPRQSTARGSAATNGAMTSPERGRDITDRPVAANRQKPSNRPAPSQADPHPAPPSRRGPPARAASSRPETVGPAPAGPKVPTAVDKGVRVRIGSGPFAGKVGTVQEIDKGVAKVLLGLLAARVDVSDLVPVGQAPGRSR